MPVTPVDANAPPPVIQTVIVTAARLPPAPGDAAFSIIRLTPQQLQQEPRLDESLEQVPGISLFRRTSSAAENPTTQGVTLRSIAPSGAGRALVTLDGVPQNDPFGGWVIWTSLPSESLEGATIVRGAGAGPYGAGALTGVIQLDELSRPGAANVDISGGELGEVRGSGATVQSLGPKSSLFLSATGEHSNGWVPTDGLAGPADDRLTLNDYSGAARIQTEIGRAVLAVRGGAYHEDRSAGLVGANSSATGETGSITLTAQPGPNELGWRLQAWIRHSEFSNTSVSTPASRLFTTPANNQYATPATGWGANAALRGQSGSLVWEAGGDVRAASGEDQELFKYVAPGFTQRRIAGGRTLVAGGYLEATWAPGDWLITGGGRIDGWWTMDGHRVETVIATGATTFQSNPPDRSGAVPTGRIGIKRDLGDGLYFRSAAYTGFRAPTINELYRPFRVGNNVTEANSALGPERLYGVEGGFGGLNGRLTWEATAFYNRLDNAVTNVTVGMGPGVVPGFPSAGFIPAGGILTQRQNAGAINAEGVEADASIRLTSNLKFRAAADYTHAIVDGGTVAPQLTGLRPAQAPQFTATGGFDLQATQRLGLHADLRYESSRFDDDLNTVHLGSGTKLDARADWSFSRSLQGYVEATNLTDARIATANTSGVVAYDEPRVVRVGLSFRY
ncbi:MAG TPA: TonB-dependent receptor [Caulobacteraceae bacterium]